MSEAPVKVLVADDEPEILESMCEALTSEGFSIVRCTTGSEAIDAIHNDPSISVVVTDISMPGDSGVQVLAQALGTGRPIKVILITGFLADNDARELVDKGCFGFLAKPVLGSELTRLVREAMSAGSENLAHDYACIPIEHFITGHKSVSSVYLRFSDGRFVKLVHAGETLEIERLNSFVERGLKELWISREDLPRYAEITRNLSQAMSASPTHSPSQRVRMTLVACEVSAENLRLMGVSDDAMKTAVDAFKHAITTFLSRGSESHVWEMLSAGEPTIYAHLSMCGVLCLALGQVMDWQARRGIEALALAGFLHDIGLYKLPVELQALKPPRPDSPLLDEYRSHPSLSKDIIGQIPDLPAEVARSVLDHHENGAENGYPRGLSRSDIFPMARTLMVVDHFSEIWLVEGAKKGMSRELALKILDHKTSMPFDPLALLALRHFIGSKDLADAKLKFRMAQSRR